MPLTAKDLQAQAKAQRDSGAGQGADPKARFDEWIKSRDKPDHDPSKFGAELPPVDPDVPTPAPGETVAAAAVEGEGEGAGLERDDVQDGAAVVRTQLIRAASSKSLGSSRRGSHPYARPSYPQGPMGIQSVAVTGGWGGHCGVMVCAAACILRVTLDLMEEALLQDFIVRQHYLHTDAWVAERLDRVLEDGAARPHHVRDALIPTLPRGGGRPQDKTFVPIRTRPFIAATARPEGRAGRPDTARRRGSGDHAARCQAPNTYLKRSPVRAQKVRVKSKHSVPGDADTVSSAPVRPKLVRPGDEKKGSQPSPGMPLMKQTSSLQGGAVPDLRTSMLNSIEEVEQVVEPHGSPARVGRSPIVRRSAADLLHASPLIAVEKAFPVMSGRKPSFRSVQAGSVAGSSAVRSSQARASTMSRMSDAPPPVAATTEADAEYRTALLARELLVQAASPPREEDERSPSPPPADPPYRRATPDADVKRVLETWFPPKPPARPATAPPQRGVYMHNSLVDPSPEPDATPEGRCLKGGVYAATYVQEEDTYDENGAVVVRDDGAMEGVADEKVRKPVVHTRAVKERYKALNASKRARQQTGLHAFNGRTDDPDWYYDEAVSELGGDPDAPWDGRGRFVTWRFNPPAPPKTAGRKEGKKLGKQAFEAFLKRQAVKKGTRARRMQNLPGSPTNPFTEPEEGGDESAPPPDEYDTRAEAVRLMQKRNKEARQRALKDASMKIEAARHLRGEVMREAPPLERHLRPLIGRIAAEYTPPEPAAAPAPDEPDGDAGREDGGGSSPAPEAPAPKEARLAQVTARVCSDPGGFAKTLAAGMDYNATSESLVERLGRMVAQDTVDKQRCEKDEAHDPNPFLPAKRVIETLTSNLLSRIDTARKVLPAA
eukprot:TRINITY_DN25351_c0_g1_i1.p1 TRINITY_DN25351_c0_g1~~TRINITY_DN25351_c0_g1_i1.p1  ORF type:complete len:888 (+),score=293.08 TRINITY_DN25351_c0_g1_i1:172-2835(+)